MRRWFYLYNKSEQSLVSNVIFTEYSIPICDEGTGKKRFTVFRNPQELYNFCVSIEDNRRCMFEIIRGNHPQKLYYDIDMCLDEGNDPYGLTYDQKINIAEQIPEVITNILINMFSQIKRSDVMVFTSHSDKKRSFHIVVDRFCVMNNKQNRKVFTQLIGMIPVHWRQFFDSSMYKSVQQFRLYMSTKFGKGRMKIFDSTKSDWRPTDSVSAKDTVRNLFTSSLVSFTHGCLILPIVEDEEIEYEEVDLSDKEAVKVLEIIKTMPNAGCFSIESRKNNLIVMKRLLPTYCTVCCKNHDNENPYVRVVGSGDVMLDCRRHPDKKKLKIGNINDEIVNLKPVVQVYSKFSLAEVFETQSSSSNSSSPSRTVCSESDASPISQAVYFSRESTPDITCETGTSQKSTKPRFSLQQKREEIFERRRKINNGIIN